MFTIFSGKKQTKSLNMLLHNVINSLSKRCNCKSFRLPSGRLKSVLTGERAKEWKTVVGLEVHAQICSKTKLFSGAKTDFGALVNNCVSPFDAAIPGTLPVLNRRCVEAAVSAAIALGCNINKVSTFDRKHYFYADLPAGYQITQQRAPIAQDGKLEFQVYTPGLHKKPYRRVSTIKQIQLEQDSGKSLHDAEIGRSLVDLNRAGTPLIEIVFEPDLEDGEEAAALVRELVLILFRLDCCSGRLQEGALRVDANVSVHLPGQPFGTRTEVKNIGSVRGVAGAIKYEACRQIALLEAGEKVTNQTMTWDPDLKATLPMRDKEVQQDYRYMPEPNLPPLVLNMTEVDDPDLVSVPLLKKTIPELPEATRQRLMLQYNLTPEQAIQIVSENKLFKYFNDIAINEKRNPKTIVNILINDLLTSLNKNKIDLDICDLPSDHLAELIDLIESGGINLVTGRKILDLLVTGTKSTPSHIVHANGWALINDDSEIEKICRKVINENPDMLDEYKEGKTKIFKAFVGLVAKETKGKANMPAVITKLETLLKN